DLLDLKDAHVSGFIYLDAIDEYALQLKVNGTMTLPCAITLKPVSHPFSYQIDDNLEKIVQEIDENAKKIENSIDILPIIWENIVMEIPMRVVSEGAENLELKGEGWKLVTEEEEKETINPELEKLKDLL
ncbi:MAG: DUF177 domain-containing protein, partial [Firmicutes bacterium]|nr:DUF177 domain-containing protein [Bacillota bacterium]